MREPKTKCKHYMTKISVFACPAPHVTPSRDPILRYPHHSPLWNCWCYALPILTSTPFELPDQTFFAIWQLTIYVPAGDVCAWGISTRSSPVRNPRSSVSLDERCLHLFRWHLLAVAKKLRGSRALRLNCRRKYDDGTIRSTTAC